MNLIDTDNISYIPLMIAAHLSDEQEIEVEKWIDNQETIEAEPVVHARWIFEEEFAKFATYKCSRCGRRISIDVKLPLHTWLPYCNCGAKMIEKQGGNEDHE